MTTQSLHTRINTQSLHNHSATTEGDQSMYNPELHTIFINSDATSTPQVILSVYVDDLLIIRLPSNVETVKEQLQKRFRIKDFGPVTTILGINVNYNTTEGLLDISQKQKIINLAREFDILHHKPLRCLLPAGTHLCVIKRTSPAHATLKFRQLVRALLYIALATRPDILHAVVYLSQFVCAFNATHFNAAKHVLQYLHSTHMQTICYTRRSDYPQPTIHCDASYGTDPLTMKSYSRNIVMWAGGPIAWWSQLQKTVALSTAEAELAAVTDATCQVLYL